MRVLTRGHGAGTFICRARGEGLVWVSFCFLFCVFLVLDVFPPLELEGRRGKQLKGYLRELKASLEKGKKAVHSMWLVGEVRDFLKKSAQKGRMTHGITRSLSCTVNAIIHACLAKIGR